MCKGELVLLQATWIEVRIIVGLEESMEIYHKAFSRAARSAPALSNYPSPPARVGPPFQRQKE